MKVVALPSGIGRLQADGEVLEVQLPHPSLGDLLRDGGSMADVGGAAVRRRWQPGSAPTGSVLSDRSTVWGVGMNYRSKAAITGRPIPDEPTWYIKAPSAFGMGCGVVIPLAAGDSVDYEGEIAVILGTALFAATAAEARCAIAAMTAANDVTAREVMRSTGNPSLAKSFPGFGQVGSVVATPDSLGGPGGIALRTEVNGEVRQNDSCNGMLLAFGELLASLSRYTVLRAGDVVLTGTPAGTGEDLGRYLRAGDTVEVRVGDLPPLRTSFEANGRR